MEENFWDNFFNINLKEMINFIIPLMSILVLKIGFNIVNKIIQQGTFEVFGWGCLMFFLIVIWIEYMQRLGYFFLIMLNINMILILGNLIQYLTYINLFILGLYILGFIYYNIIFKKKGGKK